MKNISAHSGENDNVNNDHTDYMILKHKLYSKDLIVYII